MPENEDFEKSKVSLLEPPTSRASEIIKNKTVLKLLAGHQRAVLNKQRKAETKELLKQNAPPKKRRGKRSKVTRRLIQLNEAKPNLVQEASSAEPVNIKRRGRKTGTTITDEDRAEIITLLQKNEYNFKRVSEMTGIPMVDIKSWHESYKKIMSTEILSPSELSVMEAAAKMNEDYEAHHNKFIDAVFVVKTCALERIYRIIPKEKNLRYLTETLETLSRIEAGSNTLTGNKAGGGTILQLIQNQILTVAKR